MYLNLITFITRVNLHDLWRLMLSKVLVISLNEAFGPASHILSYCNCTQLCQFCFGNVGNLELVVNEASVIFKCKRLPAALQDLTRFLLCFYHGNLNVWTTIVWVLLHAILHCLQNILGVKLVFNFFSHPDMFSNVVPLDQLWLSLDFECKAHHNNSLTTQMYIINIVRS